VVRLQRSLLAADSGSLPRWGADGIYGAETTAAVSAWIEHHPSWHGAALDELRPRLVRAILGIVEGCDISGYQVAAGLDWAAAREAGLGFAFVKISEGRRATQSAVHHVVRARAAAPEICLGGYAYGRVGSPPRAQAVVAADAALELELPVLALDLEDWAQGVSARQTIAWALAWAAVVEARMGRPPVLYVQPSYHRYRLAGGADLARLPLWHAGGWRGEGLPSALDVPTRLTPPWPRVSVWQVMGNRGRVPWYRGGRGAIDRDVYLGTEAELRAFWRAEDH
jgi:GH25 family lysozyme M1 (1,4-beta-N-acetylmuramidase)